jgi:hypothetical protein
MRGLKKNVELDHIESLSPVMNPFLMVLLILLVVFVGMMVIGYSFYLGAGTAASFAASGGLDEGRR